MAGVFRARKGRAISRKLRRIWRRLCICLRAGFFYKKLVMVRAICRNVRREIIKDFIRLRVACRILRSVGCGRCGRKFQTAQARGRPVGVAVAPEEPRIKARRRGRGGKGSRREEIGRKVAAIAHGFCSGDFRRQVRLFAGRRRRPRGYRQRKNRRRKVRAARG